MHYCVEISYRTRVSDVCSFRYEFDFSAEDMDYFKAEEFVGRALLEFFMKKRSVFVSIMGVEFLPLDHDGFFKKFF